MNIQKIVDTQFELAQSETKTIPQQFLKMMEEVGELSVEIMGEDGLVSKKKLGDDGIRGECVDVAQIAMSIFIKSGGTMDEFFETLDSKNQKWRAQIK